MKIRIKNLWYNPAESAFEGRVDIHRDGRSFRYPCVVAGPVSMSEGDVISLMQQQAAKMSDTGAQVYSHS